MPHYDISVVSRLMMVLSTDPFRSWFSAFCLLLVSFVLCRLNLIVSLFCRPLPSSPLAGWSEGIVRDARACLDALLFLESPSSPLILLWLLALCVWVPLAELTDILGIAKESFSLSGF